MGFTAILVIITVILGFFFDGGIWYTRGFISERDARLAGFEAEQPGQIDVICVGNSLGICGVDPMYLYKNYGITSYNIGCEMQMPVETYYAIQRAIKDQPVKVVLWEANNISKHHMNLDAYISGLAEAIRYRSAYIKYHYIWKNIADGYIQRKYFKGFCVNEIVKPYTGGDYYDYSDPHVDVFAGHKGHFSNWRFHNVTFDFKRMRWAKKPSAADIFRAVDGFEFIDTKFSLSAKSRR